MSTVGLTAVATRARGLGTHLPSRAVLERALSATDLDALATVLRDAGLPVPAHVSSHEPLELAARRWAAAALARLARWLPERPEMADLVFGEEDRRSVRAMVRGAAAGAAADARMAGLIPTPRLPERLLRELARQARVPSIASLLASWGHPLGGPLLAATPVGEPDLFGAERAIATAHLDALRRAARRNGALRRWVATAIDLENVRTILQLAARVPADEVLAMLHEGGAIPRQHLADAARTDLIDDVPAALATLLDDPRLADALEHHGADPLALDDALLAARLTSLRELGRDDPMHPTAALLFALRLRVHVTLIRHAIWRLALGDARTGRPLLLEVA
jgi:hypothetical protein